MRSNVFSQLDSRWKNLPYPAAPYNLGTSGCGCCSITHVIIELDKYKKYTPKDVQLYMKQFAVSGQGTLWAGITKALEHYGYKAINHPTMVDLFNTLNKRKIRRGIILFCGPKDKKGRRLPATKGGITWTTNGHFVAFVDYKIVNRKHYFYVKDSGGRRHTGWYCYETQMKGLIPQVWSALPLETKKKTTKKVTKPAKKVKKATVKKTTGQKALDTAAKVFKEMTKLKFKYKNSGNADTWGGAKKKKQSNCATYISYVLQVMGLLKAGQIFWCNNGKIKAKKKGTIAQLKKIATISHPHKKAKSLKLKPGDILGYHSPAHTQMFAGFDKKGNALWYSFGPSDVGKKLPRKRGKYNNKKIDTIIRLK